VRPAQKLSTITLGDAWCSVRRNVGAPHSDVLLCADLGIVVGPAFAGVVEKDYPKQVKLGAVIDQNMRVAIPLGVMTGIGGFNCRSGTKLFRDEGKTHSGSTKRGLFNFCILDRRRSSEGSPIDHSLQTKFFVDNASRDRR